ncbi:MAG: hypothetical protein EBZ59_06210, partial [Planctomycetia bacterium]|nr:hypothetical protein [Planctomycetia bacterium]
MRTSWIIWGTLLLAGAAALAVVVRTRWLESNTLKKCVLLSLALHTVLAVVCGIMGGLSTASWGRAENGRMTMMVVLAEEPDEDRQLADAAPRLREAGETPDEAAEPPS